MRGIPLLESRPKYELRKMQAKEACGNQKVSALNVLEFRDLITCATSMGCLKIGANGTKQKLAVLFFTTYFMYVDIWLSRLLA